MVGWIWLTLHRCHLRLGHERCGHQARRLRVSVIILLGGPPGTCFPSRPRKTFSICLRRTVEGNMDRKPMVFSHFLRVCCRLPLNQFSDIYIGSPIAVQAQARVMVACIWAMQGTTHHNRCGSHNQRCARCPGCVPGVLPGRWGTLDSDPPCWDGPSSTWLWFLPEVDVSPGPPVGEARGPRAKSWVKL